MNSFRFLERGIEAELARQRELLESGEEVVQETLHFDPEDGSLTSLRSKEDAHDYRYFPEPDLVPLAPTEEMLTRGARVAARAAGGAARALPDRGRALARRPRPRSPSTPEYGEYFERAVGGRRRRPGRRRSPTGSPASWSPRCARPMPRRTRSPRRRRPRRSPRWPAWSRRRRSPTAPASRCWRSWSPRAATRRAIVEREGLAQISDTSELEGIVDRAIEAEPEAAEQVRAGQREGDRPDRRRRDEGDQGPRRRRRGHQADQGAALVPS